MTMPMNADQVTADRCPFCGSVFRDLHECPPADVWVSDDPHLMWLETRQDGAAQRVRCLSCGPLYARDARETQYGALGMDRVRHRAYVARAAAQEAAE